jgi:hypothetical protein
MLNTFIDLRRYLIDSDEFGISGNSHLLSNSVQQHNDHDNNSNHNYMDDSDHNNDHNDRPTI